MNWFKISQYVNAPKPIVLERRHEPHNDYAKAHVDFENNGYWFEDSLEYIPISQIDLPNVWSQGRYKDNFQRIQETGLMPPIDAYFDPDKRQFSISRGFINFVDSQS